MSVVARQSILKGHFVAQYAGEMISNAEADMRLAQYDSARSLIGHALLVCICIALPRLCKRADALRHAIHGMP